MNKLNRLPQRQRGMVMIFALVVLLALTLLGVAALDRGTLQQKLAINTQQQTLIFNAAEAALAGVMFEAEDEQLLADQSLLDPISEARQRAAHDPQNESLSCFVEQGYSARQATYTGFVTGEQQTQSGAQDSQARLNAWSRTAFIQEQACRGSSNVIGGSNISCHIFVVRGCGQLQNTAFAVANTMTVSVFAPVSQ